MALTGCLQAFILDIDVPNNHVHKTVSTKDDGIKDTIDALDKQYHWGEPAKSECPIRTVQPAPPHKKEKEQRHQGSDLILVKHYPVTALTDFDFANMKDEDKACLIAKFGRTLK